EEGLIYRGNRIINWCPRCHTALSDIEVEHQDEVGELVHIRYPFVDGDGYIEVATTRAETMLGDTAVAVHPDDDRYRDAVGRLVRLPLLGREIPVVADDAVDADFGTGAVKVTPAHDPLDFEIGERHGLDKIVVIGTDAAITEAGGRFAGLDRFEARSAVKTALEAEGVLGAVEEHDHSVGHCSRCKSVIEPLLSLQWFVKVGPLVGPAVDAVRDTRTRFVPERWEKSYFHWMEHLRDWTISRQLWWGHRIPAFYCADCPEVIIVTREAPDACPGCDGPVTQDEDVLDTWFSSALWPFSTLGWPEDTEDLSRFYPTDVLVTGFDIIYFWVARMMKMGLHFTGRPPFEDVVIHGLIRTADGRKMSKSLDNALDPLELVDRYGADSVRLTLMQSAAPGQDIPLDESRVDAARRFGNKLWNAVRFAVEHVGLRDVPPDAGYPDEPGPVDRWVLSRLASVTSEYDALLADYRFSDAAGLLYNFAWAEVFDWYLEMAKPALKDDAAAATTKATLGVVLRDLLKLFHPIVPFLTEELWSELVGEGLLVTARWPAPPELAAVPEVDIVRELIVDVRRFRSEHELGAVTIPLLLDDPGGLVTDWWIEHLDSLAGAAARTAQAPAPGTGHSRIGSGPVSGFIPLAGLIDPGLECPRIEKAIAATEQLLGRATDKLANPQFRERAPAEVVAIEEAKAADFASTLEKLRSELAELC
ncbi:MAG: valine--tRNA ligase, partial [Acidimicrobiia bacterium]